MENINIPLMAANLPMMQPNPMYHAPAIMPQPFFHEKMHLHGFHHMPLYPCAPTPFYGGFTSTAIILVLFILLVIVSRSRVFAL